MSTRASYTFTDERGTHHVYKHHDGYLEGAYEAITKALDCAWPLPRFEADEFAAAFVAANKHYCNHLEANKQLHEEHPALFPDDPLKTAKRQAAGGVRLIHDWTDAWDIEFHYEIRSVKPSDVVTSVTDPAVNGAAHLHVSAYAVYKPEKAPWKEEVVFEGTLAAFAVFVEQPEMAY